MSRDASSLFTPYDLGGIRLKNRIVMAPLTRNRARRGTDTPHELNAIYYAQRATAGLIIAEATQISPAGKGYAWTPGIYNDEQIAGWRLVTDAVHAEGGKIILQLWHVGRFSHPSLQPNGRLPVGPSEIGPENAMTYIEDDTFAKVLVPRAMTHDDIDETIDDYRKAAKNALAAGFDGVEIHAANGYLLDQFLRNGANYRTDEYGGSVENRMRFPLAVVDAVADAIGAEKTGIRISPTTPAGGLSDSNPTAVFFPLVDELSRRKLLYTHVIEGATGGPRDAAPFDYVALRRHYNGTWMVNNGYTPEMALDAVETGHADLVAFGHLYVSNPDLVDRIRTGTPLTEPVRETLFGGSAVGYIDYPQRALNDESAA
jgi:N-ethylmaleimide reductase